MPNLRQSIIEQFWQKKDPRMARILGWMESMEDWMLDDDEEVAARIYSLANTLERADRSDILNNSEDMIKIMAYMSSPRALRLMEWLDTQFESGTSVELTQKAAGSDDECGQLMIDRFQTLHRLNLLSRIFAPHRSRIISEILRESNEREAR